MNPGARFRVGHKYSQLWPILASFVDYYLLVWGCGVISTIDSTPGCVYMSVINTRSFCRFWPVSWTITNGFGVPEWFPRLVGTGVRSSRPAVLSKFIPFCGLLLTVLVSRTDFHD